MIATKRRVDHITMRRASVRRARNRARFKDDVTLLNGDGAPIGTITIRNARPKFGANAPALLLRRDF